LGPPHPLPGAASARQGRRCLPLRHGIQDVQHAIACCRNAAIACCRNAAEMQLANDSTDLDCDSKISSICFEGTINSVHLMEHSQGRAFAGLDPMAQ